MADDAGRQLGDLLRQRLVALLGEARRAVEDAGALAALPAAGAPWTGTALDGHLLAPPALPARGNPVAAQVLAALRKLATSSGPEEVAGTFGWDPAAGGAPRGIACAVRLGPDGGPGLACALVVTATGLEVVASGASGEEAAVLALDERWGLRAGGRVAGRLSVALGADGPPTVEGATAGDVLRLALWRSPASPGEGPGIDLGALAFTAELTFRADGAPSLTGRLQIRGGAVRLPLQELAALIPGLDPVPLDLDVGFDSAKGVDIAGSSTLTVRLASGASLAGLSTGPLDVSVALSGTALDVRVAGSLGIDLPGVPVQLDLAGLGLSMPFSLGAGAPAGFDPSRLVPAVPTGAAIDLDLPMISGSGRVQRTDDGRYAGLISVSLPPLSVNAFGVLGLDPISLLVVLGARFPPPGIQIGFGFSVNGIGGIVGINARVDREALTRAVFDGTAAAMLFPADPQAQSRQVVAALPAIFPAAPGRVIVGPMFQLAWGGGLLTATVALLLELPDPPRVTLLGKIALSLPDPVLPLILIQVTFVGQVDPAEPSISFVASLSGSSIVGIPLTGDLFFLTRGGADAEMVLSVGGFHPQFRRPRGVPEMQRLSMELSPSPLLDLRCSAYFAVTTNSVQFGARVDLVAEIAGCGLRGHLSFDVLVELQPLHFLAEVSASVSVRVLGETLAAIGLDLSLEGPARWRARGRGTVELFLFSASFDFDFEWGDPPAVARAAPDVGKLLGEAFRAPDAWGARPPDPRAAPIVLTAAATRALADGRVVHPHGTLTARQKVLPLGIAIDRFHHLPVDAQRWDVGSPVLGDERPVSGAPEVREPFAPGEFLTLDHTQQLGRPAFESFRAGVDLVSGEALVAPAKTADLGYETKVIVDAVRAERVDIDLGDLVAGIEEVVSAGAGHPAWLTPPQAPIIVEPEVRRAVVSGGSAVAAPDRGAAPGATVTELYEAVDLAVRAGPLRRVGVVEAWELVS